MIKVQNIAYVAYRAPDLDRMEAFLTDFGLARTARSSDVLYMRGASSAPYIHVTERGEPGFVACGMAAESMRDLERMAGRDGASDIETIDGPGGGARVRLRGPDGFRIDLVHGIKPVDPGAVRGPLIVNHAQEKQRRGNLQRPAREPAHVFRLGHAVFKVSDAEKAGAWFEANLGMLRSDRLFIPDNPKQTLGVFLRCNRGAEWTDHHTIFVIHSPDDVKVHHASFEIQDYDAQHIGHQWMKSKGWQHEWGIGRHLLGSQVFDYWRDPWGNLVEHYADGDLLTSEAKPGDFPATPDNLAQWGPEVTPTFFK